MMILLVIILVRDDGSVINHDDFIGLIERWFMKK